MRVCGNLYGSNDAPYQWFKTFDKEAQAEGFKQSTFEKCLYFFFDAQSHLAGTLGAHVDDAVCGGSGEAYQAAVAALRKRFPYRKNGGGPRLRFRFDRQSTPNTFAQSP